MAYKMKNFSNWSKPAKEELLKERSGAALPREAISAKTTLEVWTFILDGCLWRV
jgi:hypothetical protein